MSLDLEIFNFVALKAGSGKINLRKISNYKQLLSVNNGQDQHCLLYSIASHFLNYRFSNQRKNDPKNYQKWICDNLFVDGMSFPSGIKYVQKIVQNNRDLDMDISVFIYHKNGVYPEEMNIKNPDQEGKNKIYLLKVPRGTGKKNTDDYHFVLIRNIDLFLAKKYDDGKNTYKKKFCPKCLCQFEKDDSAKYERHMKLWLEFCFTLLTQ